VDGGRGRGRGQGREGDGALAACTQKSGRVAACSQKGRVAAVSEALRHCLFVLLLLSF
jgi:hypothetical protein